jgi:hypothetical protein
MSYQLETELLILYQVMISTEKHPYDNGKVATPLLLANPAAAL